MIKINVPARVHMSLIDLGESGYRRNGGFGFSISTPGASFSYIKNPDVDLNLLTSIGYSSIEVQAIELRIRNVQAIYKVDGIKLKEASIPGRHVGLGAGTATALAAVEAMSLLNFLNLSPSELMRHSGRGGASGVGLYGYFQGGFNFDIGRKFDGEIITSSDDTECVVELPVALKNLAMPDWPIGIFRSEDSCSVSSELERKLFSSVLPLSRESVYETSYHAVFGSLAAVAVRDFDAFCLAVNALQKCAWKSAEINLHGAKLHHDMQALRDLGCDAVGMSSVGPTLFFLSKDYSATCARIALAYPKATIFSSSPNNQGRAITHV